MDGHRFDEIARVVAAGTSRRRVLGLISGAVAAVGVHFTGRSALAGCGMGGDKCSDDTCCSGFECPEGFCFQVCGLIGDACTLQPVSGAGVDYECCAEGLECVEGFCAVPEPECGGEGDSCAFNDSGGFSCCQDDLECVDGTCQFPIPDCSELGGDCSQVECCKGLICVDGACQEPEPECSELGGSCGQTQGSIDCCDDLVCVDGICTEPDDPCIEPGGSCEGDDDCCTGICCGGTCADIECCIDDPNPNDRCDEGTSCFEGICEGVSEICETDDDCGTGTCCCDDGSCSEDCCPEEEGPVTELPNTGAGEEPSSRAGWFGAAAIGAAAAFLGSRKLKTSEATEDVRVD